MEPHRLALRREVAAIAQNLRDPDLGRRLAHVRELSPLFRGRLRDDIAQWVRSVEVFRLQGGDDRRKEVERGALHILQETVDL